MSYLRDGDTLVVTKLDHSAGRCGTKQVVDELQQRGIGLKALSQGIEATTPGGRLFFHMLAAIAEFEHDLIVGAHPRWSRGSELVGGRGGPVQDDADEGASGPPCTTRVGHTVQEIADILGCPGRRLPALPNTSNAAD